MGFNPLYTNEFFLLAWYNKHGIVHYTYLGVSGYVFFKYCIILSEDRFTLTKGVVTGEMQHNAAFYQGLHCLKNYLFRGF